MQAVFKTAKVAKTTAKMTFKHGQPAAHRRNFSESYIQLTFYKFISSYFRKKRSEKESKDAPVYLDDIGSDPVDSLASTENLVYSNAAEINSSAEKDNKIYQNVDATDATKTTDNQIYQNAKVNATAEPAIYQNTGGRDKRKGN